MELPSYDDLPLVEGVRTSWGVFGDDDTLGCLNLLTEERAVRGAGLVRRGAVFPLDAALDEIDPPLFGRPPLRHDVYAFPSGTAFDDHIGFWDTQASTQWDGLRHIRDPLLGFYNGRSADELSIDAWARRGIVTRGVLADVAGWREAHGRPIDPSGRDVVEPNDLLATLADQGTAIEPGDILVIRTGWLGWYRSLAADERLGVGPDAGIPGLAGTTETARVLWNLHPAAAAADNPGFEAFPIAEGEHLHWDLLPRLGMPIGELWDLDALAGDCARDGVYEFLLTSAPLHLRGGVASPPNALAVK